MTGQFDPMQEGVMEDVGASLSLEECDILGEVGNMSMGAAATTMYTVLGRKVSITTPRVAVYPDFLTILEEYYVPYIVVDVEYTEGVTGRNLLLLKTTDAAMITDIMLGGDGNVDLDHIELNELHMSAISEIMNQMVAASATSLAQILSMIVNIAPPKATLVDLAVNDSETLVNEPGPIIKISFDMEIEGLLKSELMQVMPYAFGKDLVNSLLSAQDDSAAAPPAPASPTMDFFDESISMQSAADAAMQYAPDPYGSPQSAPAYPPPQQPQYTDPQYAAQPYPSAYPPGAYPPPQYGAPPPQYAPAPQHPPVNVQPVQYQNFDPQPTSFNTVHENLDMIIDVPLQVSVELGKARRSIKEVLDFNAGSVVVLDKLAGELVEVIVNGKLIARGEVVVIDENYGVRITEIVAPSRRL